MDDISKVYLWHNVFLFSYLLLFVVCLSVHLSVTLLLPIFIFFSLRTHTQGDKGYAGVQGTPGSQGHPGPKGHAGPIGPKVNESCCQRATLTQTVYRLYSWSNSFTCAYASSYGITTSNYRFVSLTGQHRTQWTWGAKRWPGNTTGLPTPWLFILFILCVNAWIMLENMYDIYRCVNTMVD